MRGDPGDILLSRRMWLETRRRRAMEDAQQASTAVARKAAVGAILDIAIAIADTDTLLVALGLMDEEDVLQATLTMAGRSLGFAAMVREHEPELAHTADALRTAAINLLSALTADEAIAG